MPAWATLFETKDIRKGWDGNINGLLQPNGVYIFFPDESSFLSIIRYTLYFG